MFKAATVKSISDTRSDPRVLVLDDGSAYRVSTLSLVLPLSDLIVFAKPIADHRALYRIMFDDGEFVDATRLKNDAPFEPMLPNVAWAGISALRA